MAVCIPTLNDKSKVMLMVSSVYHLFGFLCRYELCGCGALSGTLFARYWSLYVWRLNKIRLVRGAASSLALPGPPSSIYIYIYIYTVCAIELGRDASVTITCKRIYCCATQNLPKKEN